MPPVLTLLFLFALLAWVWPGPPRPRLRLAAFVSLFLWCWIPVAWVLAASLEAPYQYRALTTESGAEAIVVLAGSANQPTPSRPAPVMGQSTQERLAYAKWLYRRGLRVPVVATGGPLGDTSIAALMADELRRWDVDPVWVEAASRSTDENAAFTARLLRQKGIRRIALVTEAVHMRRAEAAFLKTGLEVIPAPCSFRRMEPISWQDALYPKGRALNWNEDAAHEWLGLVWYRLTGRG